MKKFFALCLCAMLLMNLVACAPTGDSTDAGENTTAAANNADQVQVGYGKVMVTPDESVPLRGYGYTEKRMSTGKWSELYLIAIAVTDTEGNTCIVISADNCSTPADVYTVAAPQIATACGISQENIIISAIHQHSAPDLYSGVASAKRYVEKVYIPGLVSAAKMAMDDRTAATVQIQTIETNNMNFVRRYLTKDGEYHGTEMYADTSVYVDQETDADNDLQLVKFVREGQTTQAGKEAKDIIVANFQGHPLMGTSSKDLNIHADMPGLFREHLENELGCEAMYISGASGNVAFSSRFAEDMKSTKDFKQHGKDLAKYANSKNVEYTDIELTAVKASKVTYTGKCNHADDHLAEKARQIYAEYKETGDESIFRKNGFESQYHCMFAYKHADLPETRDMDIFTIAFGDLAFVGAPFEMFCETGANIKAASPFKTTVICYIANGSNSYLPTEMAWDFYCYERHNSNFDRGTAEEVEAEFINMLNGLYQQY